MLLLDQEDDEFKEEFKRIIQPTVLICVVCITVDSVPLPGWHWSSCKLLARKRAVDVDGQPIKSPSNNPLTSTRKYQVEYEDGTIEELTANIIAENLFAESSHERKKFLSIKENWLSNQPMELNWVALEDLKEKLSSQSSWLYHSSKLAKRTSFLMMGPSCPEKAKEESCH